MGGADALAVYTDVPAPALAAFLEHYDLGAVREFRGIAEGVENSNFLLRTERGRFILTLFERRVADADLPWFMALMRHLAARGVRCPAPVPARDGEMVRRLCGRAAALTRFLPGAAVHAPACDECAAAGAAVARLHEAGADFAPARANDLGPDGWRRLWAAGCAAGADCVQNGLSGVLNRALDEVTARWPRNLPGGAVHADLFPDNVFFEGGAVSGIIDWYFACTDFWAYDLAIALVAWCFDADGAWRHSCARAMLRGYEAVRALAGAERRALPLLARGAALRFALTRLYDRLHPVPGLVQPKDPLDFVRRLRTLQTEPVVEGALV